MKLVLIPIAIIIAFQATTLLLGANERHIFHTTLGQRTTLLTQYLPASTPSPIAAASTPTRY